MRNETNTSLTAAQKDLLNKKLDPETTVLKSYSSKRNKVYLIGNRSGKGPFYILKEFAGSKPLKRKEKEIKFLKILKNSDLLSPGILHEEGKSILIEYIKGPDLLEIFERSETDSEFNNMFVLLKKACALIKYFNLYSLRSLGKAHIFYDINLKNFILAKDGLYRIDLESCIPGRIEKDLGRFIAYILTYNPVFTSYKERIARSLIDHLATQTGRLDINEVLKEIKEELLDIQARRRLKVDLYRLFTKIEKTITP